MVGVHADGTKDLLNRGKDIGVLSIWQDEAVLLVRVGSDGVEMVSLLSFCTKWPGHFVEYNQPVATFLNIFISVRHCTCFRRFFSVHHQELKTAHTASGICHTNT